jgi:hypothetical protein
LRCSDFTTDEINKKIQRETWFLCDNYRIRSGFRILFDYRWYFINHANDKKVIERLKDTLWSSPAREIKAVNTSFGTSRNSKLKFTRREAMQLINQLANNWKSKIGKCLESYFRPNGRKSARHHGTD